MEISQLYIYAYLFDENCKPVHVSKIPSVYSIAQTPSAHNVHTRDSGLGQYARVVGRVPEVFLDEPGYELCYKVELEPTTDSVRNHLKKCNELDAQLQGSFNSMRIQLTSHLPNVTLEHGVHEVSTSVFLRLFRTLQQTYVTLAHGVHEVSTSVKRVFLSFFRILNQTRESHA